MDNWITTREAADLLGITAVYMRELVTSGLFETRKVNNRLTLVNKLSLEGWERKRKRRPIED